MIEITACTSTLLVWAVNMFRSYRYGRLYRCWMKEEKNTNETEKAPIQPGISLIVTTKNQAKTLRKNLIEYLEQDYDQFEVIVVDEGSEDETEDILNGLTLQYSHLKRTYVPSDAKWLSNHTLALTLGVKAAHFEWIVLCDGACQPGSRRWLSLMSSQMRPGVQMVIGKTSMTNSSNYSLRAYCHIRQQIQNLLWIQGNRAYEGCPVNMAIRKEWLNKQKGFGNYKGILYGAENIFTNQQAPKGGVRCCLHPDAVMQRPYPTQENWYKELLFDKEIRKWYTHKRWYQARHLTNSLFSWIGFLTTVGSILYFLFLQNWIVLGGIGILLLIHWWMISYQTRRNMFLFQSKTNGGLVPLFAFFSWNQKNILALRYVFTNKHLFYKKFV